MEPSNSRKISKEPVLNFLYGRSVGCDGSLWLCSSFFVTSVYNLQALHEWFGLSFIAQASTKCTVQTRSAGPWPGVSIDSFSKLVRN
jgi:hypothetical protein